MSVISPDPGLNPVQLFALQTYMNTGSKVVGSEIAYRSYLFTDEAAAKTYGDQVVKDKPAEAQSVTYVVVPLEGPLA